MTKEQQAVVIGCIRNGSSIEEIFLCTGIDGIEIENIYPTYSIKNESQIFNYNKGYFTQICTPSFGVSVTTNPIANQQGVPFDL